MPTVGRYGFALIPLAILVVWHITAVQHAQSLLRTSVPGFSRILTTDNIDVRCGTFARKADAKAPPPERFFLHLDRAYTNQELSSLSSAGQLDWTPNCGFTPRASTLTRIMDWLLLPAFR